MRYPLCPSCTITQMRPLGFEPVVIQEGPARMRLRGLDGYRCASCEAVALSILSAYRHFQAEQLLRQTLARLSDLIAITDQLVGSSRHALAVKVCEKLVSDSPRHALQSSEDIPDQASAAQFAFVP